MKALLGGLLCVLVFFAPASLLAQDKSEALTRAELDARLNRQLFLATKAGVEVFNKPNNDPAGSARIFQGALIAVEGLLDHRPEEKALIEKELKRADTLTTPVEKAKALRKVIDDVRAAIEKDQKELLTKLWHRLGGERHVRIMVHEFVDLAVKDPKVDFTRGGKFPIDDQPKLEQSLVEFVSSVTGGPLQYKGKDMKAAHAEMGITEEQFDALAGHLNAVLTKHKVPKADFDAVVDAFGGAKKDIVAAATKGPELVKVAPKPLSLWKELGGEEPVKAVVHDFVALALKDEKVDFTRGGKFKFDDEALAKLEQSIVDFISLATDGPATYKGKDMKAAHAGMKITDEQFDALAADLAEALKKHNVPKDLSDELLKIVGGTKKDIVEKE